MKIDIAICTWNRARLLEQTIQSIGRAVLPASHSVRVLIVNNNSTDDTVATVESLSESLSRESELTIQLENESQQGHTFSRNCAIQMADGDLMLWTDDDVIVDSNWIVAYVQAAEDSDAAFWGGQIIPKFARDKPEWIDENWEVLKGCFAERNLGNEPLELAANRLPYGANFAIRTDIQKQFLYNTELGRREDSVLGDDEIDLFKRLLNAGHRGNWVPESSLQHIIGPERATEDYVRDYFVGQGQALVGKGESWSSNQRKLWWQALYEFALYRFQRPWAKSPAWMAHLIRSGLAAGQVNALAQMDEPPKK